jgi:hypothetical protein
MTESVLDLDVLRPPKRIVRLGGHDIDCSFVPLAITFDLEDAIQGIDGIGRDKILKGGKEARQAFDLSIKLCSIFCSVKHPDMTEQWFRENVDPVQLHGLASAIREALQQAYAGIDPKNAEAAQTS